MLGDVRTMKPDDVPSAMELSAAANWNQTPEDLHRLMQLSPQGFRCIEDDGKIVATTSLLPYGRRLAWIGMVLTRPEYRRQGHARRLMEDAITAAERSNIRTLKLDATGEGRPLYESLGFVVEETVERWARDDDKCSAAKEKTNADKGSLGSAQVFSDHFSLDAEAFGVERRELLKALSASGRCSASESGYVLSRPGRVALYLGPCVVRPEAEARQIIGAHLEGEASGRCQWYWDLLPANPEAVRCATGLGFTRRRVLWRMRRGEAMENNNAMVYAIAGFELG